MKIDLLKFDRIQIVDNEDNTIEIQIDGYSRMTGKDGDKILILFEKMKEEIVDIK